MIHEWKYINVGPDQLRASENPPGKIYRLEVGGDYCQARCSSHRGKHGHNPGIHVVRVQTQGKQCSCNVRNLTTSYTMRHKHPEHVRKIQSTFPFILSMVTMH